MIGFNDILYTVRGTTGSTTLSLINTLYSSPLHARLVSQSSLVVSWQRIYNSLRVISNHTWSRLFTVWFLSCHYSATVNSEDSIQLNSSAPKLASLNSTQFFSTELFSITTLHGPRRKHRLSIFGKACLQRRCISTEVTRLLLAYSLPRECVYGVVT
jgi:hypothetical protein